MSAADARFATDSKPSLASTNRHSHRPRRGFRNLSAPLCQHPNMSGPQRPKTLYEMTKAEVEEALIESTRHGFIQYSPNDYRAELDRRDTAESAKRTSWSALASAIAAAISAAIAIWRSCSATIRSRNQRPVTPRRRLLLRLLLLRRLLLRRLLLRRLLLRRLLLRRRHAPNEARQGRWSTCAFTRL